MIDSKDPSLFRGLNGLKEEYDLVIVGAGLSGAVIAERARTELGLSSLVIDKREHIGGNCYDYIDQHGIRVSLYGVHIFHTKFPRVENYVKQFSDWIPYQHRVVGRVRDQNDTEKIVPIPPNIDTVNILFDANIDTEEDMIKWLDDRRPKSDKPPKNGEEMSISRVGTDLYEKIFKPYTKKQWDKYPSELGPEVTARIPVRNNFDGRYFGDPHQALPTNGYTAIFDKMLESPKITTLLNTDYFDVKDKMNCKRLYFSGPIDAYFAHLGWDKLEYRSLNFERKVVKNTEQYQPASVVNHPQADEPFTRIVEYKHLLNQKSKDTILFIETSNDEGDPYYPVPNKKNKDLYKKYQEMAEKEKGVTFVGRLANYKYFNMDEAILNALELFDKDTEVMAPDATEGGPKAGSLKKSAKTPDTVAIDKSVGGAATDVKRRAEYGNEWKGAGED